MVQWRNSLLLIALFFCGQNLNAADFSVQVGEHVFQDQITGATIQQIDFPAVSSTSNLSFNIDANSWSMQDTEMASFGLLIERDDKQDTTATDEYRRAIIVVRSLKIEDGIMSLTQNSELYVWAYKLGITFTKKISNLEEVSQYINVNNTAITVDYHGLRDAAGLTSTSNPNGFEWKYRMVWSNQMDQGALQPISIDEIKETWLPFGSYHILLENFTEPFSNGYGISGDFSVGKVAANNINVQLNSGWNLVEFPFSVPLNESGILIEQVQSLWQVNVAAGTFAWVDPQHISSLTVSTPYWIKLSNSEPFSLSRPTMLSGVQSTTGSQWSLVSVASDTAVSPLYIQLDTQGFWHWDGEQWQSALSEVPAVLNGFDQLQPGHAYYYQ